MSQVARGDNPSQPVASLDGLQVRVTGVREVGPVSAPANQYAFLFQHYTTPLLQNCNVIILPGAGSIHAEFGSGSQIIVCYFCEHHNGGRQGNLKAEANSTATNARVAETPQTGV